MARSNHSITIRRGAAYDSIQAGVTVIDLGKLDKTGKAVKANIRQEYIDLVIGNLKSKGFFNREVEANV